MGEAVTIVGCGYTGLRLARRAVEAGYRVAGTSRDAETLRALEQMGAAALRWDVLEDGAEALAPHLGAEVALVYSVPTLYRTYEDAREGLARHVAPVARVVEAAADHGLGRFVYLSSTSVYGDHEGRRVDEQSPTRPTSPMGRMRLDVERFLWGADVGFPVNIARLVGIYGPGRTLVDYIASGRYKLVDGGVKRTNRVHVDDIVRAVLAIIERAPEANRVYNICDGHPLQVVELVDFLVSEVGLARPEEISLEEYAAQRGPNVVARWKNTYRCDNARLVEELGVELAYPDALAGYRAVLGRGVSDREAR